MSTAGPDPADPDTLRITLTLEHGAAAPPDAPTATRPGSPLGSLPDTGPDRRPDLEPATGPDSAALAALIRAHQPRFQPLFERLLDTGGDRLQVVADSLRVDSIEQAAGAGVAQVTFVAEFFAACRGVHEQDRHKAALPFALHRDAAGTRLEFMLPLPPVWSVEN